MLICKCASRCEARLRVTGYTAYPSARVKMPTRAVSSQYLFFAAMWYDSDNSQHNIPQGIDPSRNRKCKSTRTLPWHGRFSLTAFPPSTIVTTSEMALRIDGRLRGVRWFLIARCRLLVPKYDMRCICVRGSLLMDWGDATSEMLSRIAKMYATLGGTVHGCCTKYCTRGMTQLSPEILAIRTSPATDRYLMLSIMFYATGTIPQMWRFFWSKRDRGL